MAASSMASLYQPKRLFGSVNPGSLATLYSPGGGAGADGVTIYAINTLAVSTTLTLYAGISGYTGNASNAILYNWSVPADGGLNPVVENFTLNALDNIQALCSLASGVNLFGKGIELG